MESLILVGLSLVVVSALIGLALVRTFATLNRLDKRLADLEGCRQRRLPYNTAAGIEDATAINLDLVRQAYEVELELAAIRQRAQQQAEVLQLVRQGPDAYPIDRPAGLRPNANHPVDQK